MLEALLYWDQKLFLFLNQLHASEFMDSFFLAITNMQKNKPVVVVALLLLFTALIKKYGKQFWKPALVLLVTVGLADLICYRVIKQQIGRTRPFQTETVQDQMRKVGHAHGPSFPSNHAANSFAGAIGLSYLFPNFAIFFFVYAALVAFSRVYVGVHYPLDVIVGALIGIFVAILIHRLFRNQVKISTLKSK